MTDKPRPVGHRITVDTRCYPVPAVHKTLYALSTLADAEIHFAGPDCLEVTLFGKGSEAIELETSFRRLLADFTIQAQVNAETAPIRQALVTAALVESLGVGGGSR